MTEKLTLIDSDVLIGILRKERTPYENAKNYLSAHQHFNISCLTWHECHRGYKTLGAEKRLREFHEMMKLTRIQFLDEPLLLQASDIYASLHKRGKLTGEFDLLIGITTLQNGWKLATNNIKHYQVLVDSHGLEVENWITSIV